MIFNTGKLPKEQQYGGDEGRKLKIRHKKI